MSTGFLDTSGWFAALSPKEAKHRAAHATYRSWIENERRIRQALALDEHFELAGFERVP